MLSVLFSDKRIIFLMLACGLGFAFFVTLQQYRTTYQLLQKEKERVVMLESEVHTLSHINQQNNSLIESLQQRHTELLNTYSERRHTVQRTMNENITAKNWGSVDVPDDIKRLFQRQKD